MLVGETPPVAPAGDAPAPTEPDVESVALPAVAAVAPIARAAERHIATALRRLPGVIAPPDALPAPPDAPGTFASTPATVPESPVGAAVGTGPTTGSPLSGFTGGGDPFTTFEELTAVFAVPAEVTGPPKPEPEFVVPATVEETVVSDPALAGAVPRPTRSAAEALVLASPLAPIVEYVLLV